MKTWKALWQLARVRPYTYLTIFIFKTLIFCVYAQAIGFIFQAFFDTLTGQSYSAIGTWELIALIAVLPVARAVLVTIDILFEVSFTFSAGALLRKNLFARILSYPGAQAIPGSAGEAISYFRDDVDIITQFMDDITFIFGYILFSIVALVVMSHINALVTVIVFAPLAIILIATKSAMKNVMKYRHISRQTTGMVTKFIGEVFGAIQAVKVSAADEHVIEQFEALNEQRRKATIKDTLFSSSLSAILTNTTNIGVGIVLLMAGQALQKGTFTVGDFSLFAYYLSFLSLLTNFLGSAIPQYKQVGVSFERLAALLQQESSQVLLETHSHVLNDDVPSRHLLARTEEDKLTILEARNLTYHYPNNAQGIKNISLHIPKGAFTVITGRVGSGKTTLLRVLLGLLPKEGGTIYWNNHEISDPGSFFVPPHSAYTPQVPVLFSGMLKNNILMGLAEEEDIVARAIKSAVMEQDISDMPEALETVIGRRGVKFSGGQLQRTAAARMFVRNPELLVCDDLSSALDIRTESTLWERLFDHTDPRYPQPTCLVVSHRDIALQRADHIIVLKDGCIEAEGTLEYLFQHSTEMQLIWQINKKNK